MTSALRSLSVVMLAGLLLPPCSPLSANSGDRHGKKPDNGLIAFADAPASEPGTQAWQQAHIFTVDAEGRHRKRVTRGAGGYLWPVWSPDGKKLAYMYVANGRPEVWIMNADGNAARRVTDGLLPAWSPDGRRLAFFRGADRRRQIWVIDADGKNERRLTAEGINGMAAWSPDGGKLAFWSGDEKGFGQVWIMSDDGIHKTQLTFPERNAYTPKGSSANAPAWLSSRKIAYWSGVENAYGQIWIMDADGRNKKQLTTVPPPASSDNPASSPDGTRILFDTQRRGRPEIWIIDADGSNERLLIPDVRVVPARASWQPVWPAK